ncbi:MAG: DUF4331 domain-containing protein [Solirubrobacterales bacterium]|nr:DUF4331 domain-containing protein [Solirubrobacterales bacterium]
MKKIIAVAGGLLGALAAGVLVVALSAGSSHREAPSSTRDPQADWTDVYAFTARDAPNALTIVGNLDPFQLPQGGPNYNSTFDPKARYYINVDNTGDGRVDVRYRFEFKDDLRGTAGQGYPHSLPTVDSVNDPDFAFRQRYTVVEQRYNGRGRLTSRRTVARNIVVPGNVGPKTMPNYDAVVQSGMGRLRGGGRVFVGARDDPFFIDLGGAFDSINLCRGTGNEGGCRDDLAGFNVNSIVLQLPEALVTRDRQSVTGPSDSSAAVGVWTSTDRQRLQVSNSSSRQTRRSQVRRRSDAGWTQVNRLGNPLVNELVVPLTVKDKFNRTKPHNDKQYGAAVLKPFPAAALNALFGLGIKETGRTDIVQALLTGIPGVTQIGSKPAIADTLKVNLGVPPSEAENRFGVIGGDNAGFPNGRRLADDAVDITLRVVGGYLVPEDQGGKKLPLGDGVDRNNIDFLSTFPYVAPPQPGRSVQFGRTEPVHAATPGENPR